MFCSKSLNVCRQYLVEKECVRLEFRRISWVVNPIWRSVLGRDVDEYMVSGESSRVDKFLLGRELMTLVKAGEEERKEKRTTARK